MLLAEIQEKYSQNRLTIQLEQQDDGTQTIVFFPLQGENLDFAITQANRLGLDLIKLGHVKVFNAGVTASVNKQNQIFIKVYLALNRLQLIDTKQVDYSSSFYSTKPHIENIILTYFKGQTVVFLETEALSTYLNSPTKFFEEFAGWTGYLLDQRAIEPLFKFRSLPITQIEQIKLTNQKKGISFKSYIENKKIQKIDWLCINEKGLDPIDLIDGMQDSIVLPTLITLNYESDSLSNINSKLEEIGYKLDKIYYQYAFFVRQR